MTNNVFRLFIIALSIASLPMVGCQQEEQQLKPTNQQQKISYAISWDIATDLKSENMNIDWDLFIRGLKDELDNAEPLLSAEEMEQVRESFLKDKRATNEKNRQKLQAKNQQEELDFLTNNANKEGVVTLPSGLQYKQLTPGNGVQPQLTDNVKVHYRGYFVDGTEFENTYTADQPAVFPVNRVISGWTEALQLMPEGAKWEVYVPSALAYGERGAGNKIGPNRMLVFELELLGTH